MSIINCSAPELVVSKWLNASKPLSLSSLRGRVVVVHAFQMLCPGCVSHALPQAKKLHELLPTDKVVTLGLHCVFEHHRVMDEAALDAFVHEYRLSFPIAIDQPTGTGVPKTMSLYQLRGTPSTVVIDKNGKVRLNHFGRLDDMFVGSMVGQLLNETVKESTIESTSNLPASEGLKGGSCDNEACAL